MRISIIIILLLIIGLGCRDKYIIPAEAPATGFLVVEGNINNGNIPTVIRLSRTTTVTSTMIVPEENASVLIEGEDNIGVPLQQASAGVYSVPSLLLSNFKKYRLHITTQSGKQYLSDFVPVRETPPIDSISWQRDDEGVTLYVNAHDDGKSTIYYLWDYVETWEHHSDYGMVLRYKQPTPTQVPRQIEYIDSTTFGPLLSVYTCWSSRSSNSLLLGSTAKLSEDRVYIPVRTVPAESQQISVLYSLYVRQYALTKDAYEYLDKMRKNTETTGSIFDPQPSSLQGNIHSANDPNETVIGFVNISTTQDKRKFIYNREVPSWNYRSDCESYEIPNHPDSIADAFSQGLIPTEVASQFFSILTFYATPDRKCVDCTLTGSNVKPDFWP